MTRAGIGIASYDCPSWLRRRWGRAWRENDTRIISILVDFLGRWSSGELIWR